MLVQIEWEKLPVDPFPLMLMYTGFTILLKETVPPRELYGSHRLTLVFLNGLLRRGTREGV
jgi:hypothetical protein